MAQSGVAQINSFFVQKDMPQHRGKAVAQCGPGMAYSSSSVYLTSAGELDNCDSQYGHNPRGVAHEYPLMHSEIRNRVERLQQLGSCSVDVLPVPTPDSTSSSEEDETSTGGMPKKKDKATDSLVSKKTMRRPTTSRKVVRFSTAEPEVVEFVVADVSPYRRRERLYKDNFRLRDEPEDESPAEAKKFTSLDQLMMNFKKRQSSPSNA